MIKKKIKKKDNIIKFPTKLSSLEKEISHNIRYWKLT